MTTVARVTFPSPDLGGQPPCPSCAGAGVTGETYTLQTSEQYPPLLVDVFCPGCGGCGRANHTGCVFLSPCTETLDRADDLAEDPDEDEEGELEGACPSCQGRTWWICQGFAGEGEDTVMHHLRVPCGCTEGQVQYVER